MKTSPYNTIQIIQRFRLMNLLLPGFQFEIFHEMGAGKTPTQSEIQTPLNGEFYHNHLKSFNKDRAILGVFFCYFFNGLFGIGYVCLTDTRYET